MNEDAKSEIAAQPPWQPLARSERRVLGVLVEKAKTTPENYPLSLNALVSGCNQKSNRSPQMQLELEQVDEVVERLRGLGALVVIQGDGRVDKVRHKMYDWLGVDKVELAVMAELLLRGAQTIGELRGRAARMEPISGVAELRPVLDNLREKGLIVFLTPMGRGCVVTHALYQPQELDKLRAEYNSVQAVEHGTTAPARTQPAATTTANMIEIETLRSEVGEIKQQIVQLRAELDELKSALGD